MAKIRLTGDREIKTVETKDEIFQKIYHCLAGGFISVKRIDKIYSENKETETEMYLNTIQIISFE